MAALYDVPAYSRPLSIPRPRGPSVSSDESSSPSSSSSTSYSTPRRSRHSAHRPSWERATYHAYPVYDSDADDTSVRRHSALPAYSHSHSYEEESPLRAAYEKQPFESELESVHPPAYRKLNLRLGRRDRTRYWDQEQFEDDEDTTREKPEEQERVVETEDDEEEDCDGTCEQEECEETGAVGLHRHEQRQADEFTPTCADALRHKWQAISLSWRFTIFRAKRRIRRRIGLQA